MSVPGGRGLKAQKARVPRLDPPPEPVRISKRDECIVLAGVPEHLTAGDQFVVRLAYDVRRGDPFKKWAPQDFDLGDMRELIRRDGAMLINVQGQTLEFAVERMDFEIVIEGFDPARDIRVKVDPKTV